MDEYIGTPTPLTITTTSLPSAVADSSYSATIGISGGVGPFEWSQAGGKLPPGVKLDSSNGSLAGTPKKGGDFAFVAKVTDEGDPSDSPATADLQMDVSGLSITTTSLPAATVGQPYTEPIEATGETSPYHWNSSGHVPPGLSLDSSTGVISGTPTAAGTFKFKVHLTDSSAPKVQKTKGSLVIAVSG